MRAPSRTSSPPMDWALPRTGQRWPMGFALVEAPPPLTPVVAPPSVVVRAEKKPWRHIFALMGFSGFDGEFGQGEI